METGHVSVGETRIYWASNGSGPAILFIHAGVADSRMWADQMALDGYRSIVLDKRGYGNTAWVPGPYSDSDDSMAVLDRLGVETATVVGCSMGAGTTLDLAIDHPDRVDRVVLAGAFPSGWVPEEGWEEMPLEKEAATAAEAGDFDRMMEIDYQMWLVGYGRSESEVDPAHRDLFFDMDRAPVITEAEREVHQMGFEKKLDDHLDAIRMPALVVVGIHDEPLLVKAARYMAERLGQGDPVIIDGAAHLPSLEQPHAFNDALITFLQTH